MEGLPVEISKVSLTDAKALAPVVADVEYVFHIAGSTKVRKQEEYSTGNVETTKALLAACVNSSRLKKFCHISTLSAVGPSYDGLPLDEQTPCRPMSIYGRTKYEAEQAVTRYSDKLPTVILRPPTVYGPRDTDVLEIYRWVNRGIMPVVNKEDKKISMIHVHDLARGIVEATLSETTTGKTYFISNRPIYQFSSIVQTLAKILGKKNALTMRIPALFLYTIAGATQVISRLSSKPSILSLDKAKEMLQPHWICSSEKIKTEIGFETAIPLEDGLRSTYEWYRAQGWM